MNKAQRTHCRGINKYWFGRVTPRVLWEQGGRNKVQGKVTAWRTNRNLLGRSQQDKRVCAERCERATSREAAVAALWGEVGHITKGLCPSHAALPRASGEWPKAFCSFYLSRSVHCQGDDATEIQVMGLIPATAGQLQTEKSYLLRRPCWLSPTSSLPNTCCQLHGMPNSSPVLPLKVPFLLRPRKAQPQKLLLEQGGLRSDHVGTRWRNVFEGLKEGLSRRTRLGRRGS